MDGRYGFVLRNMQYPPPPYPPPMVNTAYNQLGEADNPPGQVTRNGQYRNTPLQATEPPAPVQGHSFLFDSFSNVVLDTPVDEGLDGLQRGLGFSSASPSQTQSSPMHMQGESFQNPGIMGVLIPPPVPPDNHLGMHLIPPQITPIHAKTGKISSRLKQPLSLRPEVELRAPWLLLYYNKKGGEPPSTALLDTVLEQESTITKCTFPRCEKTYKSKSKIPASAHYHVLRHIGYRPCECPAPDWYVIHINHHIDSSPQILHLIFLAITPRIRLEISIPILRSVTFASGKDSPIIKKCSQYTHEVTDNTTNSKEVVKLGLGLF
ncbi:hypothetical protein FRC17_009410 [Serendipita sp. 399]|nr:hypothetical protein FRC17_009410 [Serendipita sp. 399]